MEWLKLTSRGILRGSLSHSTDVIQLVWIKLICLMNETKFRNGRFEYAPGKPMGLDFIASNCGVTQTILEGCLAEYEEDINPETKEPRIKYDGESTLVLTNWELYQGQKIGTRTRLELLEQEIAQLKKGQSNGLVQTAILGKPFINDVQKGGKRRG